MSIRRGLTWATVWFLVVVVLVFFVIRLAEDLPNLSSGVAPPTDDFGRRYFDNPTIAYLHIVPGVAYLLGATIQLSRWIRARYLRFHRALGRWVLAFGLVSGVFAIAVGIVMPFGGVLEGSASVVFGLYFLTSLILAFRAVRLGDLITHRRWMIRAFAVGLAVGTIRIWIGLFQAVGVLSFQDSFGPAFWLAFILHSAAAELWLRWRPAVV